MQLLSSRTEHDSRPVDLAYVDYGTGDPVVLIHGWPLSHRMWEPQIPALVDAGQRVLAYDRRGFGDSDAPWGPYDYDTLADDLANLLTGLDLWNVTLVGFSMGGGEVARYLSRHGSDRIARAALISAVTPLVPQLEDNPAGVPRETLEQITAELTDDRLRFLSGFVLQFHSVESRDNVVVSGPYLDYLATIAAFASERATFQTAEAWASTDFRTDMSSFDVPTLVVHGTDDRIVPIATAGEQAARMIPDSTYEPIEGAPHALNVTHADRTNELLRRFLRT